MDFRLTGLKRVAKVQRIASKGLADYRPIFIHSHPVEQK